MRRVEYRIEEMPLGEHNEVDALRLTERLNELGKEGWEVASVDLTFHPSYSPAAEHRVPVPVLLERELAA